MRHILLTISVSDGPTCLAVVVRPCVHGPWPSISRIRQARRVQYRVSEKKAAKLSEFSLNFPKLADWLCMGCSVCQAAAKAGNSNRGDFFAPACNIPPGY